MINITLNIDKHFVLSRGYDYTIPNVRSTKEESLRATMGQPTHQPFSCPHTIALLATYI